MLAVRGEGILSWTGNDNFVVEDRTTATPEVIAFLLFVIFIYTEQEIIIVKNRIESLVLKSINTLFDVDWICISMFLFLFHFMI